MGYQAVRSQALELRAIRYFVIGVLLIVFVMGLYYWAWKILMSGFGIKIGFLTGFRGFMLSFVARYIPGTVWGYLNRNEWLALNYGVPYRISNWGSIYEIALTALASVVMIGIHGIVQSEQGARKLWITLLLALLISASYILVARSYRLKILERFLPDNDNNEIKQYPWQQWFATLTMLIGNWFLYGVMVFLCAKAFGLDTPSLFSSGTAVRLSGIFSLSWLAGFVILFLPSGLGVREITLAALLPTVFPITTPQAAAVSVAARLIIITAELMLVVIFVIFPVRTKNQKN